MEDSTERPKPSNAEERLRREASEARDALARARDALLEHTRRALLERLQLGEDDFTSVMRLLHSRLSQTRRFLRVPLYSRAP